MTPMDRWDRAAGVGLTTAGSGAAWGRGRRIRSSCHHGGMSPAEHLDSFDTERAALRRVLAGGDGAAAVPSCPGWSLTDLGLHVGTVYRFALGGLRGEADVEPAPDPDVGMLEWFDTGAYALSDALGNSSTNWAAPAWTMGPPQTAAFWARRMHHETALHRWDAETAVGLPASIDDATAADGIAEVATVFFPRQIRLGRIAAPTLTIEIAAHGHLPVQLVVPGADAGANAYAPSNAEARVSGPASTLLLALWRRVAVDAAGIELAGDVDAARRTLEASVTP